MKDIVMYPEERTIYSVLVCELNVHVFYLTFLVGQMGAVKIYLSQGDSTTTLFLLKQLTGNILEVSSSQRQNFMRIKQDAIARFIHVMTPLANIYQLPLTSLHIFYDLEGGIIAFNRNGSIFLNLRYFEAWRKYIYLKTTLANWFVDDTDVERGKLGTAYISW